MLFKSFELPLFSPSLKAHRQTFLIISKYHHNPCSIDPKSFKLGARVKRERERERDKKRERERYPFGE